MVREYREYLSADVVTGRLDVRGIQVTPSTGDESIDDTEGLEETDLAEDAELLAEADD